MSFIKKIIYFVIVVFVIIVIIASVTPKSSNTNNTKDNVMESSSKTDNYKENVTNSSQKTDNTKVTSVSKINGTAYYIDQINGNDSNSGTSEEDAWKTLKKVSDSKFKRGDGIFLKRGNTWNESIDMKSSGSKDSPITIGAYGEGKNPLLNGSKKIDSWTKVENGIFKTTLDLPEGEALGTLVYGSTMQYFVPWNSDYKTTLSNVKNKSYSFENKTKTIFFKTSSNPNEGEYFASTKLVGIKVDGEDNVAIENIDVEQFSLNGIGFINCDGCKVTGGRISKVGGVYIFDNVDSPPNYIYAGNGIDYSNSSKNGVVRNVVFSEIFDSCLAIETWKSRQKAEKFVFSDLFMDRCGFDGFDISVLTNDNTKGSFISDVIVKNITITDSGKGWSGKRYDREGHGIRVVADIGAGTVSGVSISDATITNSAGNGIEIAGDVGEVQLQKISISGSSENGIKLYAAKAETTLLNLYNSKIYNNGKEGIAFNAPKSAGFKIKQNTFYNNGKMNIGIFGQSGVAEIKQNIFSGTSPISHIYSQATLSGASVDNNCYKNGINMIGYDGKAYSTLDDFRSKFSFEKNGIGVNSIDFTNKGKGNFTFSKSSACDGKGVSF